MNPQKTAGGQSIALAPGGLRQARRGKEGFSQFGKIFNKWDYAASPTGNVNIWGNLPQESVSNLMAGMS